MAKNSTGAYADRVLMPALRARGVEVVDLRGVLPCNTTYPLIKTWSTRPVAAISLAVVHYDAQPLRPDGAYNAVARYAAEAQYHINQDWGGGYHAPGLAYHLKIDGAGRAYICQEVESVTWNANDANGIDYAICVDLGEGQQPTPEQLVTLQRALDVLDQDCPELPCSHATTYGHGELQSYGNSTACPGALLPYVQRYRATGSLLVPAPPTPQPTPPPLPPEVIAMLTDAELAAVAQAVWGEIPFVVDFAIPKQWLAAYRAGTYLGRPLAAEATVNGLTYQEFEAGLIVYRAADGYASWRG
jgi:hypothetical protein